MASLSYSSKAYFHCYCTCLSFLAASRRDNRAPLRSGVGFADDLLHCLLHHAQNLGVVLSELRRVLRDGGRAVIYEDIPETWWDRLVCAIHNRKWLNRTGPCTFHSAHEWRMLFSSAGFEVVDERRLSRWRNLAHPVSRRLYVLSKIE